MFSLQMGDIDSGQEEPDDETVRAPALDADRSSSPEPQDPPPATNDFCDLDLREQWVYVKPVLQAILRDEYAPAREQNFTFFASDTGRKKLTEKASARGTLTPKEIVRLRDYILEWCLRDAKHATRIEDEAIDAALEEVAKAEVQSEAGPPPFSQLEEDAVSRPSSTQPPPSSTAPSDPGDDTVCGISQLSNTRLTPASETRKRLVECRYGNGYLGTTYPTTTSARLRGIRATLTFGKARGTS